MTSDPVLAAIQCARHRRDQADRELRLLIAYAREVVTPRPYRLADVATAAGLSISGVRTAYTTTDVHDITARLTSPDHTALTAH